MWKIAWCNLVRDKLRFGAALVGLVLAVVLMAVQASIFLGAIRSSSLLVSRMDAQLWIVPYRASNADFSAPLPARRKYQALGVAGVEAATRVIVGFSVLRFRNGRQEPVIVVGTDTEQQWLPIDPVLLQKRGDDGGRAIVLDERERWRFGERRRPLARGTMAELNGHRVFVADFTRDMGSFTITPYVFTTSRAALDYTHVEPDNAIFVAVRCEPGADPAEVRAALVQRMPDVEVLTREQFAGRSWRYWVMGTGMGFSLVLMAALALIVGITIVGQTFLTGVRVKLREYAVLKAMGFRNRFVAGIVIAQGLIVALLGYALGLAGALAMSHIFGAGGTSVSMHMPPVLLAALLPLTLAICIGASLAGAWNVFRLAPAEVFR